MQFRIKKDLSVVEMIKISSYFAKCLYHSTSFYNSLDEYLNFEDIKKSKILTLENVNNKDEFVINFLELLFFLLPPDVEEIEFLLSIMIDSNNFPANTIVIKDFSITFDLIKSICVALKDIFLIKIDILNIDDPIYIEFAKKDLTFANYLYLLFLRNKGKL